MSRNTPLTAVRRTVLGVIGSVFGISVGGAHPDDEADGGRVDYENLSAAGQRLFDTARSEAYATSTLYELPDRLAAADTVRYRGVDYVLTMRGRHVPNYQISTTPVESATDTVSFDRLSADERRAFRTALADGSFSAINESPETFQNGMVVSKDGSDYRIEVMWGTSKSVRVFADRQ